MTDYGLPELAADPAPTDPPPIGGPTPITTATPVVMGVVIALGVAVLAVIVASAYLAAVGAPPLPDLLLAVATTATGALAALLAGTLTTKAGAP